MTLALAEMGKNIKIAMGGNHYRPQNAETSFAN
jgi:hypothetical protein